MRPAVGGRRLVAFASLAIGLALAGFLAFCALTIPKDGGMASEPTPAAVFMAAAGGEPLATRGVIKGEKIKPDDLPPRLKQAMVAIEDRRFYDHRGIDLRGIGRAVVRNLSGGGSREGASTITQQLARRTYLSADRSLRRKVQEAMLALWMETKLSKDEILARYLDAAYFGAGAHGADAAARRYFGKGAKELDIAEAATLAGLVRAPTTLAPTRNPDGAKARAALVIAAMVETGAITAAEADAARAKPVVLAVLPDTAPGAGYFVDLLEAEARKLGPAGSDMTLASTLDPAMQATAEAVVQRFLGAEGRAKAVGQAALVALAPDGAILAMVGGRDYAESQFNRATQAKRQAGSLFKLFVYLAALERGLTPATTLVDRPLQIGEWEPENASGRFRGPVSAKSAFAGSINTVAVQIGETVGVKAVIDVARRLGVASDLPAVPSLSLGSAGVTLLEMTEAYAAVATNVDKLESYGVRELRAGDKILAARASPAKAEDVNSDVRQDMVEMLVAVVREGTGKAARIGSVPVGGKTGTTQDNRDAWFVGFAPGLTVGVWVGNDDNSPTKVTGGDLPARMWRAFVAEALKNRPARTAAQSATAASPRQPALRGADVQGRLTGVPVVLDSGTLGLAGQEVRLAGVDGFVGRPGRELDRYLAAREVACDPEPGAAGSFRCTVGGQDLARLVISNGGGVASADAPPDLKEAEAQARAARLGIWRRRG